MGGWERVVSALRGARRVEWIALIALLALAVLLTQSGTREETQNAQTTPVEQRMESVLSMVRGAGKVRVLVRERTPSTASFASGTEEGQPVGVVVVAEGANDLRVALELARAVQALLGVEMNQIEVLKMEEGPQ